MGSVVAIENRRRRSVAARVVLLTLLLGATVVVSWFGIRRNVFNGPGRFLDETWLVIWAVQALLAFGLVLGVEWMWPSGSRRAVAGTVLAAWIGELFVVAVLAPFLADELEVWHAPWVWLIATGFIVQPIAAIGGGLVARGWRRP